MITKKQLPPKAVEAFFKANLKVRDQRDALVVFLNAWPGADFRPAKKITNTWTAPGRIILHLKDTAHD
jgi:hypothetical protein